MKEEFGLHYAQFLDWMQDLREPMAAHYPSVSERRALWYEIVESDVLTLLQNGLSEAAYGRIAAIVGPQVASAIPKNSSEKLAAR